MVYRKRRHDKEHNEEKAKLDDSNQRTATKALYGKHSVSDVIASFFPIAAFITLGKLATYLSYQRVSISLAHTAKSSEPIFHVLISAAMYGEFHSLRVYFSLIMTSLGIAVASVTDWSYNHTGFMIAVASAICKVLQHIFTKRQMSRGKWTVWETHVYCTVASLAILLPCIAIEHFRNNRNAVFSGHGILDELPLGTKDDASDRTGSFWLYTLLPLVSLIFDSILQWSASIMSYHLLSMVCSLTSTIINVCKRLVLIVAGSVVEGMFLASGWNAFGVLLALLGILLYNLSKFSNTKASVLPTSTETSSSSTPSVVAGDTNSTSVYKPIYTAISRAAKGMRSLPLLTIPDYPSHGISTPLPVSTSSQSAESVFSGTSEHTRPSVVEKTQEILAGSGHHEDIGTPSLQTAIPIIPNVPSKEYALQGTLKVPLCAIDLSDTSPRTVQPTHKHSRSSHRTSDPRALISPPVTY